MFITFPADEKTKNRLDAVFETALIESEHDVLTTLLSSNVEDRTEPLPVFRSSDDE